MSEPINYRKQVAVHDIWGLMWQWSAVVYSVACSHSAFLLLATNLMPGTGYIFTETESPLLNFIECDI